MSDKRADRLFGRKSVALVAAVLAGGALVTWQTMRGTDHRMRADLLSKARIVAQTVDLRRVVGLSAAAADRESADYLWLKDHLAQTQRAVPECHFVYLMGRRPDGTVFFYADSEPAGSQDESPPGQIYDESTPTLLRAFATGQEDTEGPETDRWGTWISALVPLVDTRTGTTLALLGMDVSASNWRMAILARSAMPAALTLVLLLAMGSVFLAARRSAEVSAEKPVLRRLLLPLAVALILLVGGFGAALLWQHNRDIDKLVSSEIAAVPEQFSRGLKSQGDALRASLSFLVANPHMRAALQARDRDRLLSQHRAVFDTLRQEHGIQHFSFHDPDRVNIVRLHKPETYGDLVERFTTREAQRTGKTACGIELGSLSTFTLRAVEPVFDGGALLGFVELGKDIEEILETSRSRNMDIAVVVRKDLLNRTNWEANAARLGGEADWDRFPAETLLHSSLPRLPAEIDPYVAETGHRDGAAKRELTCSGTTRRVAFLPLRDVADREVGRFIVLYDVTAYKEAFVQLLCLVVAGCLLLLALLFGFFYVMLKRTDRGIEARTETLRQESLFRKAIIANAAEGLCVCHEVPEYPFVAFTVWNDHMTEITGYTMDEINRLGWHQTMYPDPQAQARAVERMARMRQGDDMLAEEWVITRRDGQPRTLLISTSLLLSNEARAYVLAVMQDVTEHQRALEELRRHRDHLEKLVAERTCALGH